jgi:hypothetical protein
MLSAEFSDPLYFNSLTAGLYNDGNRSVTSLAYRNDRYFVSFGLGGYKIDEKARPETSRDYGASAFVELPLYQKGRDALRLRLSGYMDDEEKEKNPKILALNHTYAEHYGLGMQYTLLSDLSLYGKEERDDRIYGVRYGVTGHLFWESYLTLDGQYSKSLQSGVELSNVENLYGDITDFSLIGLEYTYHANRISKIGIGLEKVMYLNHYFLYFPVSLRRESLFFRYDNVELEGLSGSTLAIDQTIIGMNFDFLFIHKLPFAASLKYVKNSESNNEYALFFDIGYRF